ncbi:MAG: IPT/TIG domain-containing protein [Pyrinomonadaceae bacterium]
MKLFEGKSKNERNKIIAAMVLGFMCLVVFYFAFLRGMFAGSTTTITVKPSPTPKPATTQNIKPGDFKLPSEQDQRFGYETTEIRYVPGNFYAPDPGRNIFAFYEPPAPCRENCPTPTPRPPAPVPPATPAPTPPIQIAFLNPQSVYAGSKGFRLEIAGDNFTPETRIYFSQQELPTTFVSAQRITADLPGVLITSDGQRQVLAQTIDGKLYSNPVMLDVQPAPRPQVKYIGMIARKRSNNDTAYFSVAGKELPIGARLNDIVEGRFRLLSISHQETILEDTTLGFRHKLPLTTPPPVPVGAPGTGVPAGFPTRESYVPFTQPGTLPSTNSRIPGIPDNIPRYIPPGSNTNARPSNTKQNSDDDDDTDNK